MSGEITVLCWNFQANGGSNNAAKRVQAHELLASFTPDLVLRQEMWGADSDGASIKYDLEDVLGLRGWLGPKAHTAVFANPSIFQPVREWPTTGPMWVMPPTALTMRYLPAGSEALPLVVASYHLNYYSPTVRLAEAEWLTTLADKKWTTIDGDVVRLPCLIAGDNNSYAVPGVDGDLPLPVLEEIADRPHRAHRSHPGPDGRLMDTRADETLRTAGLEDLAHHCATAKRGDTSAVSRTVNACATHGPDSRIDRIYTTTDLLPAVTGVDIIEVDLEISDHHIVRATLDTDLLSDILNRRIP